MEASVSSSYKDPYLGTLLASARDRKTPSGSPVSIRRNRDIFSGGASRSDLAF